jgi:hypothetical protein
MASAPESEVTFCLIAFAVGWCEPIGSVELAACLRHYQRANCEQGKDASSKEGKRMRDVSDGAAGK